MALIPPQYLKAVASIEIDSKNEKGESIKLPIATGFLLGYQLGKTEKEDPVYGPVFITNRHVYENQKTGKKLKNVYLRFNKVGGLAQSIKINLLDSSGNAIWLAHKNDKVDIAIILINAKALKELGLEYYLFHDEDFLFAKDFLKNNITVGDGLYVLGFPMGIRGKARNFVIVRRGILARADEELLDDCFYYIDAAAYPGNSGGPVIHKPEALSIVGTKSNQSSGLMGIISSGETYSDVAVSSQTQEPRIIFTEQTGLVRVVPIELVIEAIADFIATEKLKEIIPEKTTDSISKN